MTFNKFISSVFALKVRDERNEEKKQIKSVDYHFE